MAKNKSAQAQNETTQGSQQNENSSNTRGQAAKDMGKSWVKGTGGMITGAAKTVEALATEGVVGAAKQAAKTVIQGAKDAFSMYKNLFKVIFNDSDLYGGNHPIPINETRPMGMINYKGIASKSTMGYFPKLSELYVDMFKFDESDRFDDNISALFEGMRLALRSNLTYSQEEVKRFVLNNISLYIIAKYYEKKLGFLKYEDPLFPEFRNLWITNEIPGNGYNVYPRLIKNSDFDSEERLAHTLDIYEEICQSAFRFILPENMKKWIDHYIGSLFVLDDDVLNPKYMSIVPGSVPYYNTDGSVTYLTVNGLTVAHLKELISNFRHTSNYTTIRTDIVKIPTLANARIVDFTFAEGWFTPYEQYQPVPIIDLTMKQALINGYTSSSIVRNGFARIDMLPDNGGDSLTTLLFMGALYNTTDQAHVFKVYGIQVQKLLVKVFASDTNTVELPNGFNQSGASVMVEPFALSLITDVSSDVYVDIQTTTSDRIYYPNGADYAVGTMQVTDIATDLWEDHWYDLEKIGEKVRMAFPIAKNAGSYIMLVTVDELEEEDTLTINAANQTVVKYITIEAVQSNRALWPIAKAFGNHTPVALNAYQYSQLLDSSEQFGRTGSIRVERYYTLMYAKIDIHNAVLSRGPLEGATWLYWILDVCWPNGDLAREYVVGEVPSNKVNVHSGYIFYPQWIFTVLGYSIPVINSLKVHTVIDSADITYTYNESLMKEDYIPTVINVNDIPAVMSKMICGLTKFHK